MVEQRLAVVETEVKALNDSAKELHVKVDAIGAALNAHMVDEARQRARDALKIVTVLLSILGAVLGLVWKAYVG